MTPKLRGILGPLVVACVGQNVARFRVVYAWLLVALGLGLMGAVVGVDFWAFPTWPVHALTVALVVASLLHARLCRGFEEGQVQTWERLMALASGVEAEARKAGVRPPHQPPPRPSPQPRKGPPLRIVRLDEPPDGA